MFLDFESIRQALSLSFNKNSQQNANQVFLMLLCNQAKKNGLSAKRKVRKFNESLKFKPLLGILLKKTC